MWIWVLCCYEKTRWEWIVLCPIIQEGSTVISVTIQQWRRRFWSLFVLFLYHFEVYVTSLVEIYTDHNLLIYIQHMKNQNTRLLRWSLFLQEYQLEN